MNTRLKLAAGLSAAMVLAAVAVSGCGSDNNNSGADKTAKAAKVAYLTYIYADYQQAEVAGMKEAFKASGSSLTTFSANFDPTKQQKQCTDAISSGRFNVIVLASVTPPTGVPCVTAAKAAGIPVVAMETNVGKDVNNVNPQVAGVVGSVQTAFDNAASNEAKLVEGACAGKNPCNIIADTVPGDPFGAAFLAAAKSVSGVKIIQNINTNYDPTQMQKIAADTFAAHPDADVLLTLSDQQALAAVPARKEAGLTDKVALIGAGGSRQGAQAIADGVMFGTLGIWPKQIGKIAGEMAVKAANGEKIDPAGVEAQDLDEPDVVTKDNVSEFKPEWGASAQ
jgi:ribose transport system substrate-binding protein